MSPTKADQLLTEALSLPVNERVRLAAKILESVPTIVVANGEKRSRRAGSATGRVRLADDFDPPPELSLSHVR